MSVKVWKRENSLRPEKISPLSRKITKRSESKPPRVKVKRRVWSDPTYSKRLNSLYKSDLIVGLGNKYSNKQK